MPMVTSADRMPIGYEAYGTCPTLILVSGAIQYRAVDAPAALVGGSSGAVLAMAQHGGGMGTRWGQPVLLVDGDQSFAFMAAGADMAANALSNVRRKTLVGQDHGPAPDVYAPVIREFLNA